MKIKETVHRIGYYADKALDERDVQTLRQIAEDCFNWIADDKYNVLEKGILAYHGATSCSDYIQFQYNGALRYTDEENNEDDFEMCLLLFRKSIDYLSEYNLISENELNNSEGVEYCRAYLCMAYTNFANLLQKCGRMVKALTYLKVGFEQKFPMAIGNFAGFLIDYAYFDYDEGHQSVFANESYRLLMEVLADESKHVHEDARAHYERLIEKLKLYFPLDFLEKPYKFDEYSLGDSEEEIDYRQWCLKHMLFLNTLNDVFMHSVAATDILHLPTIITKIEDGPRFHGLFNQIKQEYVSARYMIYDALFNREPHFSDKDVHIVNTLDYPVYGVGVEKMKYAYRSLYSLFDRIAYLVNDYFELGIKASDVSYRSIWQEKAGRGKNSYKLNVDLKKKMTSNGTFNLPLIGLYWLCKDIGKQKVKHHYLDPAIEELAKIRHHLEHRYLKVHDSFLFPMTREIREKTDDPLAYSITVEQFEKAVMELLFYVREGIILLSLAINVEEQLKKNYKDSDQITMSMHMDQYDDEWKQIF
ncbi:LA2681 family HEPN domain-containing protein [Bacillus wiedmannii]|uniref:LA2681 family HEPN domain-containing protein n=1 Tax=Bacillus wiedmannii TaxID=1890302 RepID=UPI00355772AF